MKNILLKSLTAFAIVLSFGLKASCPPLPDLTAVQITNIPSGYYAIQTCTHGYEWQTYTERTDWSALYSPLSGTEVFPTDYKFDYETGVDVSIGVYVKQYSYSSWTFYGSIWASSGSVTRSVVDKYLYYISFSWNSLNIP